MKVKLNPNHWEQTSKLTERALSVNLNTARHSRHALALLCIHIGTKLQTLEGQTWWKTKRRANSEAKPASEEAKTQTEGVNRKQRAAGHLLLLLSCALLLWSVWLGDVGSGASPAGSASKCGGPSPGVLSPPSSRDASSSGRDTHLRLLPSDDCTPKTQLEELYSKTPEM